MRYQFLLVPAAIVVVAPSQALDMQELTTAQALIFPSATLTPANFTLTDADAERLARESGSTVFRNEIKAWKTEAGDCFRKSI